jgi:CheY-like chemotaxis protein
MPPTPDKVALYIVEDDANIRYLAQAAATRAGVFEPITTFVDGESARDALRKANSADHPALIVSDLSMPRMSGIQLIEAIKADPATQHVPIAIITSSDLPHDRDDALRAGACAFLHKPYGIEALTKILHDLWTTHVAPSHAGSANG